MKIICKGIGYVNVPYLTPVLVFYSDFPNKTVIGENIEVKEVMMSKGVGYVKGP